MFQTSSLLRWLFRAWVVAGLLLSRLALAQNQPLIDSLQRAAAAQTDTTKGWTLTKLAWEYRPYDKKRALAINEEALAIANQAGFLEQQGFCWMALGNVHNFYEQDVQALKAYQTAELLLRQAIGGRATLRMAQLHYNWGQLLQLRLSDQSGAIRHQMQAMRVYERLGRTREQAICLNAIANSLWAEHWVPESFAYYRKAEAAALSSGNLQAQVEVMNDFYSSYLNLYAKERKPLYLELVIRNLERGVLLIRRHPEQIQPQYLPTFLTNLAEARVWQGDFARARQLLQESNTRAAPLQDNNLLANNYSILANIEAKQHRAGPAEAAIQQSGHYLASCSLNDQVVITQRLQETATLLNDWHTAHYWLARYATARDSLMERAKKQTVRRLTIQYEVEKKDLSIRGLRQETSYQRRLLLLAVGLALLLLLGAAATIYSSRLRRRLAEQHLLLSEQRAVVDQQEKLLAHERQKQLQLEVDYKHRELASTTLNLERKNELLLALRKELEQVPETGQQLKPAFRLIDRNLQLNDDLNQFRRHFEGVHPGFFQSLAEQAQGPLSSTELRYCAYLRLGLSTKEIASLLRIEPHSVRVGKHRLKQKLRLDKHTDLEYFINKL